jgi:hypothetical protein
VTARRSSGCKKKFRLFREEFDANVLKVDAVLAPPLPPQLGFQLDEFFFHRFGVPQQPLVRQVVHHVLPPFRCGGDLRHLQVASIPVPQAVAGEDVVVQGSL